MSNSRDLALKILTRVIDEGGYSNIVIDKALSDSNISLQDKRFCSALCYGTVERIITLDYIISKLSSKPLKKLNKEVLNILRMSIYQLKYMDSVPDSAGVNEAVILVKKAKLSSASGFVNAILRSFIRNNKEFELPKNKIDRLSVEYSAPKQLVSLWIKSYGEESAISLLRDSIGQARVTARYNSTISNGEEKFLLDTEIKPQKSDLFEHCYFINSANITFTKSFQDGLFHIQDMSSQMCCKALSPLENQIVIDLCSAPGGKAFTLAQIMGGTGKIYAFDLHENRVNLIKEGAERLKLGNIIAQQGDALEFNVNLELADRVLCDVPCSGLGVIRRKPEIKYKDFKEFANLPEIQYKILENASRYLKNGGELVYSTCTLNPKENDMVIDKFLNEHSEFEGVSFLENLGHPFGNYKATIFTEHFGGDGFFIAKIRKIG